MTNVRNYTDIELLDKASSLPSFKGFPTTYWALAVRSNEDANDLFDDKVYIFCGEKFIMATSCTTNKGNKGTGVVCADVWNYGAYQVGLHKGKTLAGVQRLGMAYSRDFTSDEITNPTSPIMHDIRGFNFHAASHDLKSKLVKKNIGGWSEGCIVMNDIPKFVKIMEYFKNQKVFSLVILTEF
jgi:hypothetical protein